VAERAVPIDTVSAETLADSLELVLPHLSPALAGPGDLARLRRAGQSLPASLPGGFEFRLGTGTSQVDLLQRVPREANYPARLQSHIDAAALAQQPAWERVRDFCAAWSSPASPLFSGLTYIWLEFDLDSDEAASAPNPSIFAGLDTELPPEPDGLRVLHNTLAALAGPVAAPLWASVERCVRACPENVIVSHLGVMLARPPAGVRLNIARLARAQLPEYLQQVGWTGPLDEAERLADWAYDNAEWVTLCLDVSDSVYPKFGLECSFDPKHADQVARWVGLLDACVALGVCTDSQRAGLLSWPGLIDPASAAQPWPRHLMLQSLAAPADQFIFIRRRISHIKLVYQPGRPLEAKGYLGFETVWG
jgi:hypothetical protein